MTVTEQEVMFTSTAATKDEAIALFSEEQFLRGRRWEWMHPTARNRFRFVDGHWQFLISGEPGAWSIRRRKPGGK